MAVHSEKRWCYGVIHLSTGFFMKRGSLVYVSDTLQLMLTFGMYTVSLIASVAALIDNNQRKKTIALALTGRRLYI